MGGADLYRELRRLARARLRHGGRNTLLDTGALVHEAYLRMADSAPAERQQWLAYASRTMRSVVVDMARRRQAQRRGGEACVVTWTDALAVQAPAAADDVLRVHQALDRLEQLDARLAQVVEMRYFAGLDDAEIAAALGISDRTVRRDWDKARRLIEQSLLDG
ncbi:MAG: sigma-70 family RNA polymerase sigma factor [Proteobacteria bacterium]|nr:sigma-70 family RNA polymerase sigma factor [Pseudomonadota bacterium]